MPRDPDTSITTITAAVLGNAGHPAAIPLWLKVVELFRVEQEVRVEWTAPGYKKTEISILWGALAFSIESGERRTFVISGKKSFCDAVVKQLSKDGNVISAVSGKVFK